MFNWFFRTGLIAITPTFIRLALTAFGETEIDIFTVSDLAAFCLVVHVSTLDQLEHLSVGKDDETWKSAHTGLSRWLLLVVGVFYAADIGSIGSSEARLFWTKCLAGTSLLILFVFNLRREKLV